MLLIGILVLAVVLSPIIGSDKALGQTTNTSGDIRKFDGVNVVPVEDLCIRSTEFEDMPEMTVSFRQSGGGPVIVLFQGRWFNNTGEPAQIRIRLAIDTVTNPDEKVAMWTLQNGSIFALPLQINGASGMNWVTDSLTQGSHVATIQWRSERGQEICVSRRTLIVLHS